MQTTTTSIVPSAAGGRPRVALYGHDTVGLGHVRRNLALARALAAPPLRASVLVLSGAVEAGRFPRPPGVDVVTLPSIDKGTDGAYVPGGLGVPVEEVLAIRAAVLRAALTSFAPELLVVDKVALGLGGELEPALRRVRSRYGTRTVLGLRDVLDEPGAAWREWRDQHTTEALRRHYDEVWVYGDPTVHDLVRDCPVPPGIRDRVHYVGYLAAGRTGPPARPAAVPAGRPYVLGLVGGGQDGTRLAEDFLAAGVRAPAGRHAVLVTGPYLPGPVRRALTRTAHKRDHVHVVQFSPDVDRWIAGADAVVAMGGYNTVAEILATGTPALVVPRVDPREEQWVRAARLAELGAIDVLHPDDLSPERLLSWLARPPAGPDERRRRLRLDGLESVRRRATRLLGRGRSQEAPVPTASSAAPTAPPAMPAEVMAHAAG